jgi:quinolinate synthase
MKPLALSAQQSVDEITSLLMARLKKVVPSFEIELKAPLIKEILTLKNEKNAVILGHNYMEPLLFNSIPDIVGDSLELCRQAAKTSANIIVFCGVEFMAETAKVLNPSKKVLIPSKKAGCSLASGITAQDVRTLKALFPGAPVVTYINTYAEVKAETDICCTSGNAAKIISSLKNEPKIIFLPDEYLAGNVAKESGRTLYLPPENGLMDDEAFASALRDDGACLIGWRARCEVHDKFTVQDVRAVREQFDDVTILAHPECPPSVVEKVDFSGSTSQMISYLHKTDRRKSKFLLLTECSMSDNLSAEFPEAEFLGLCSVRCQHMNQITLEDTLHSLSNETFEVVVPDKTLTQAKASLERMLLF